MTTKTDVLYRIQVATDLLGFDVQDLLNEEAAPAQRLYDSLLIAVEGRYKPIAIYLALQQICADLKDSAPKHGLVLYDALDSLIAWRIAGEPGETTEIDPYWGVKH